MSKCRCGCGAQVRHWFVAGHDAKLRAWCLASSDGNSRKSTKLYRGIRDHWYQLEVG